MLLHTWSGRDPSVVSSPLLNEPNSLIHHLLRATNKRTVPRLQVHHVPLHSTLLEPNVLKLYGIALIVQRPNIRPPPLECLFRPSRRQRWSLKRCNCGWVNGSFELGRERRILHIAVQDLHCWLKHNKARARLVFNESVGWQAIRSLVVEKKTRLCIPCPS